MMSRGRWGLLINIKVQTNLMTMSWIDPDVTSAVNHHEPVHHSLQALLLVVALVYLRNTVLTRRKTEILRAR